MKLVSRQPKKSSSFAFGCESITRANRVVVELVVVAVVMVTKFTLSGENQHTNKQTGRQVVFYAVNIQTKSLTK